ncbi:MAG: tRNA (N(6)-L-threonylcarbamoyladenosine(37)-C(2))-methylthiotransferase MtaB [Clostridia bacterium]|nr:tRNA (N(6)-L-threonylcarbamoyladenosine(37)-C(2))-methylthiotransferase MtaB [Clostridia bacterium]
MSIKPGTCAFLTLGCRVNQYETQAIREKLLAAGFRERPFEEENDVYVINTCAVTGESARKSRQMIRRALRHKETNPAAIVCAAGCYTQGEGESPDDLLKRADLLFGNTEKAKIADAILRLWARRNEAHDHIKDVGKEKKYEELTVSRSVNARAFLKIEDGCNSFCSYCYVPLVRGRVRSRPEEDVLAEAKRLCDSGYREIVLTGIETGAYGEDLGQPDALARLALKLALIPGIERIRFSSLKPTVFTESFCGALAGEKKIMPHFHLSLQSGSDAVLAAMRRRYGRREEEEAIDRVRRYFPDCGLSADLIVGFPGEKETDFLETDSLIHRAALLHTHIFPYSPRKGTLAASMPDQVVPAVKKERAARLLESAKRASRAFAEERTGRFYTVLCEKIVKGEAFGYTENFLYTRTPAGKTVRVGELFPVILGEKRSFSVETMTVICRERDRDEG